ncbi:hypothetical protein PRIPAC_78162 [Pristionchus pacificus]|uniref:Oxidoreductase-like domain-containing protein n=1 Tax=Pristionchus pacificus TaxID=54126 RepID=A0A2A6BE81_PRIPA|nr:hypothetical protein PRIPAC_78162 [Pristionchus pacificus]|eukprot:PDM64205.1 hypothetical protein PRIPAC_54449 [Pristionchus pacificus]
MTWSIVGKDWMLRVLSVFRRSFHRSSIRLCEKGSYDLPEEPIEGSCCGQGCVSCVWITYGAEVLRSAKKIPKEELKKILEEKIKDPSIRQYVLMELKIQ